MFFGSQSCTLTKGYLLSVDILLLVMVLLLLLLQCWYVELKISKFENVEISHNRGVVASSTFLVFHQPPRRAVIKVVLY